MNYVIIGACAAALSTAEAIRKADAKGNITMLTEEAYLPYSRPSISYFLKGKVKESDMALRKPAFYKANNINVVTGKVEEFKVLVLNDKTLIEEENINYKIREDNSFRIRLKRFSKNNNTILVIKSDDYYLTDGFSEFFINRYINVKNKSLDIEAMLSGLISVGVASASNNEERFISVLVAIMTMAVSEKKAEQKNLIYSEDISFMKYLEDEIKNINANELIKLSKIDYLFTR